MTSNRQDAWSQDEDLLLAEVVLRHIREGGTQLQAFEEVGRKLSRTAAACGFRWNSFVRKQYKSGIELAKRQRKENKKQSVHAGYSEPLQSERVLENQSSKEVEETRSDTLTIEGVIDFLENLKGNLNEDIELQSAYKKLEEYTEKLEHQVERLNEANAAYRDKLELLEEDHQSLLSIFEKARKMALLQENEDKVKFQMDKNGNLQRLQK
ncbi:RsfA family transcriptional regulator [Rossellomorea vietnamensis]|uniref:RsfA family transcriptional regulator n=1 Tax=Rossellomorea vietnamensis TaxID=218284 RepID=A0A5D4KK01_9BACI|nr:RsfA family transcriptional regulator [Rossellomorea vietnamensis]TYR77627.1 RsfA family transcriptional regulator [Rossellomorea vietnamensis]